MSSNQVNTSTIETSTRKNPISWSAVGFMIFVSTLLIICVVLILYFEKLCCFARYRFLKHILKPISRRQVRNENSTTKTQLVSTIFVDDLEHNKAKSSKKQEYFWIAGHREHVSNFEPLTIDDSSSDLPDDDYITLVPPVQQNSVGHRKLPQIPIVIETKENNSSVLKGKTSYNKPDSQQKTKITAISRRYSSNDHDPLEKAQSAPTSPAFLHKTKSSNSKSHQTDRADLDSKSASSEQGAIPPSGANNILSSGTLDVRLKFDAKNSKMWVFVMKATIELNQLASKQTLIQIHLTMLPNKRLRFRTRAKPADNAMFAEEFFCKVSSESIPTQGIRFRLYTNERFKREKFLAEAIVMFGLINLDEDMCKTLTLERAYPSDDSDLANNRSPSRSKSQSRKSSVVPLEPITGNLLPEIEIGLAYDRNHSNLILEISKGSNLGISLQGRPPDTYAQITLLNSNSEELISNRTVTRRSQYHPIYAERYSFNIQDNLIDQITLVIKIINKKSTGKTDHVLGWVLFGRGANGNAQAAHWDSMLNAQGEIITRWHTLLES